LLDLPVGNGDLLFEFVDLGILGLDGFLYYCGAAFGVPGSLLGVFDDSLQGMDALLVVPSLRPFHDSANG